MNETYMNDLILKERWHFMTQQEKANYAEKMIQKQEDDEKWNQKSKHK